MFVNSIKAKGEQKHLELGSRAEPVFTLPWASVRGSSLRAGMVGTREKFRGHVVSPSGSLSHSQSTGTQATSKETCHECKPEWKRLCVPARAIPNPNSEKITQRGFKLPCVILLNVMYGNCLYWKAKFCVETISTNLPISRRQSYQKIRAEKLCWK